MNTLLIILTILHSIMWYGFFRMQIRISILELKAFKGFDFVEKARVLRELSDIATRGQNK